MRLSWIGLDCNKTGRVVSTRNLEPRGSTGIDIRQAFDTPDMNWAEQQSRILIHVRLKQ